MPPRSRSRKDSNNQPNPASSSSSDRRRQREDSSSSQPHHVMTQPVFIQKFLPYAASKPASPVVFKTVTTSWQETTLKYSGALLCWSALFKKYKNKSNDDDATEQDLSAKEILQLLGTAFEKTKHPHSLWIVTTLFEVLEYLTVSVRWDDIKKFHLEVFASLFKSCVCARTKKTLTFFNRLFAVFEYQAVSRLFPDVITNQFDPYDLPSHMDGVVTKIIEILQHWAEGLLQFREFDDSDVGPRTLGKLADFLELCFRKFPGNNIALKQLLAIVEKISQVRRQRSSNGCRVRRSTSGLTYLVGNGVSDTILTVAMKHSTPEAVKKIISFLVNKYDDKNGKDILERCFILENDDYAVLQHSILMKNLSDYKPGNLAVVIDQIIKKFGNSFFVKLCSRSDVFPMFDDAADDWNDEIFALLMRKIQKAGGNKAIETVIEARAYVEEPCNRGYYHKLTGKSSIHFALEKGEFEMVKFLIKVAEELGKSYLKKFMSLRGHCTDYCVDLPPLYFALKQSNSHVTKFIVETLQTIGDDFLRDQIDKVFDFGGYCREFAFSFETSSSLIRKLSNFVVLPEIKLLLERNLKKYAIDDCRNFVCQLQDVDSAKEFVKLVKKIDGLNYFREAVGALKWEIPNELDYYDEEERKQEHYYDCVPSDVIQYLKQSLKSMEAAQARKKKQQTKTKQHAMKKQTKKETKR